MKLVSILLLAAFLLVAPSCSKDDGSGSTEKFKIDTADGKGEIEASSDGLKGTMKDKDGKVHNFEMSGKVDPKVFEGLLYEGAVLQNPESMSRVKTNEGETNTASFSTNDPPAKVSEHYKKILPDAQILDMGESTIVNGKTKSGATLSLTIAKDEETKKTTIMMMVMSQTK